jgi:sialic acid synthase SpsE
MKSFIGERVFVIAEIGANHCQNYDRAASLIQAASFGGANAVKIQMFTADSLAVEGGEKLEGGPWSGSTLYELYEKASLPYEWVPKLKKQADKLGLKFITSVYDLETVDIAEQFDVEAYKIASFEVGEERLIRKVGMTDKPIFVSTGNADFRRIAETRRLVKHKKIALLKCTSAYPAPLDQMNLRTILDMRRNFGPYIGLSDHTTGIVAPVVATAMGARVVEKHIKIDEEGLDASFSIDPRQFMTMVCTIRAAEETMGKVFYGGKSIVSRRMIDGHSVRVVGNVETKQS